MYQIAMKKKEEKNRLFFIPTKKKNKVKVGS